MFGNGSDVFDSSGNVCDELLLDASDRLERDLFDDEYHDDGGNGKRKHIGIGD
jgi:hypothetical protein